MADELDRQPPNQPPNFSYTIDEEFVRIVATGTPTAHAFDALVRLIKTDPRYRRGMPVLHDRRNATTPTSEYAHQAADVVRTHARDLGPCRWAVIVGNHDRGLAYGMSRMISALHEATGVTSCPFTDVDAAVAWLTEVPGSGADR